MGISIGEIISIVSTAIGIIPIIVTAIEKGKEEIKYFNVLPGEFNKEVQLAKDRKNNGDKFNPSYEEYIETLRQGKIRNCIVQIKWERHYSKSEWTAFLGNY